MLRKNLVSFLMTLLVSLLLPLSSMADVILYWLDISASMNKDGQFESAKSVLIREVENGRQGDTLYIGAFDTNDYVIGKLTVDESGSSEEKQRIVGQIKKLRARGLWTNLDEPIRESKALLLEERSPGARRIVLLSDGLSDPSPDHKPVDLKGIADMVPQDLGWSLYLIGLSSDIEGLFQTRAEDSKITFDPQYPHVKGIPLAEFSHEKIEDAVETIKNDSQEPPENKESPSLQTKPEHNPAPWPVLLGALVLAAMSISFLLIQRTKHREKLGLVLEVRDGSGEGKEIHVSIEKGKRKTAGPNGEIQIEALGMELPPIVFSILWQKESLWLQPQDSITVNGKLANGKVLVGIGDLIKVRDKVSILIKEGGDENVTE